MATHILKIHRKYFQHIVDGTKTFEIRKNDRGYRVGDELLLKEIVPEEGRYTGRETLVKVTYLTTYEQQESYVVMAIKRLQGAQYYYFKKSGKWKYWGEGASIPDSQFGLTHARLKELNGGLMPGILGNGEEYLVLILDNSTFPRMVLPVEGAR